MPRAAGAALVALLLAAAPGGARAQEVEVLADACGGGMEGLRADCLEAALAFQATAGMVGLAASGGVELPGAASTLGRRLARSPRIGLSLRLGGVPGGMPALLDASGPGEEADVFAPVAQGVMTVGVFDGFSPLPTVGGLLSLDLQGSAGRVFLPTEEGYQEGANVFGIGARVGLLRESFTLPGVTVSVSQRWADEVRLGAPEDPERTGAAVDVATTSVRATVGKDLLALGLLGGVGWDRYETDGRIQVRRVNGPTGQGWVVGSAEVDGFRSDRTLVFGGVSYTFLVVQLSAEAGWARGYDAVERREGAAYDPEDGTFFGSLAARLTF